MSDLEKYLKGVPLNPALEALMKEPDQPLEIAEQQAFSDEMTEDNREHLRRLFTEPGWQVLLQLLDRDIETREDAARRTSIENPMSETLQQVWADVAYSKQARERMVRLAENEIRKATANALLGR